MIKPLFCLLIGIISLSSFAARTDCPAARVLLIQIEGQKVLYAQEGASWRALGYLNKNDGTKERYSALLASQVTGNKVMVGYPVDNYDCSVVDYGTSAHIVRTYSK